MRWYSIVVLTEDTYTYSMDILCAALATGPPANELGNFHVVATQVSCDHTTPQVHMIRFKAYKQKINVNNTQTASVPLQLRKPPPPTRCVRPFL